MTDTKSIIKFTCDVLPVRALIFRVDDQFLVCGEAREHAGPKAEALNMEGWGSHYYLCCVADCFDPPRTVVKADTEDEAWDIFLEERPWARVSTEGLGDYLRDPADVTEEEKTDGKPEDKYVDYLHYSGDGHPYDAETQYIREVFLERIDV